LGDPEAANGRLWPSSEIAVKFQTRNCGTVFVNLPIYIVFVQFAVTERDARFTRVTPR
jgi:hypothetical protein